MFCSTGLHAGGANIKLLKCLRLSLIDLWEFMI